jgi:pimeloyl-ACP methyl ester carboxylesterase
MVPIESRFAQANGSRIHYLAAGETGSPVILLHGYAQNSHMWRPLMEQLGKTHRVIAPDLRGFGDTTKAESGYEKKTMAQDVHALARSLGIEKAAIAGHDIGLMVAYAYAAQYPAEVTASRCWTPSSQASATRPTCSCSRICGTFISTGRRRSRS